MRIYLALILIMQLSGVFAQQEFGEDSRVENQSDLEPGEDADEKIRKNFFLKADVTKTDCYVGEVIMATFKAYSRLDANSQVLKRPSLTGFSVIEMVDAYNTMPETEKYKGIFYNTHLIRKVQMFPLQPGTFTIEAAEIESVIHLYKPIDIQRRSLRNLFRRNFRNTTLVQKQLTLETPPVTIHVKPLPEKDQPEDFSGAVGNFVIDLQMADNTVNQYQPATVKLVLSGTGNLPLITDPQIEWPKGFDVTEPQVTEDINKYNYPLGGLKIFEYTVPTRDTGTFAIPPVKFSYFDPAEKKYKTISTKPLSYTVAASNKLTEVEPIETGRKKPFPLHLLYFGIIVTVIIAVIILQVVRAKKRK